MSDKLLGIYLNDHLAGSTAGLELVRRAAGSNRDSTYGSFLDELAAEIAEDRRSLLEIMRGLGVGTDRVKTSAAWTMEKLGRLKLNGQLRGYSPLSRVVELEALALAVRGKLNGWRALLAIRDSRPALAQAPLEDLIGRAERQLDALEAQRLRAVAEALE